MIDQATLFGLCGAVVIGIGVSGFVLHGNVLRRLLAINVIGSGIFLMLGAAGGRASEVADPVPQALIITGIVVALSATALGMALLVAYGRASGSPNLPEDTEDDPA